MNHMPQYTSPPTHHCRVCGQAVPRTMDLRVDLRSNTVTGHGVSARLTPKLIELLDILCRHEDRVTSRDEIMAELYGPLDDLPWPKIIDVMVCRLRKALEPFGYEIRTERARGFQLVRAA